MLKKQEKKIADSKSNQITKQHKRCHNYIIQLFRLQIYCSRMISNFQLSFLIFYWNCSKFCLSKLEICLLKYSIKHIQKISFDWFRQQILFHQTLMEQKTMKPKSKRKLLNQGWDPPNKIVHPFVIKKSQFQKSKAYCRKGRWSFKEKLKFCLFLDFYRSMFVKNFDRRHFKLFKFISSFMKTKNSNQCRSHHQKVYQQYKSFDAYIAKIVSATGRTKYKQLSQLYEEELRQLGITIGMQTSENHQILIRQHSQKCQLVKQQDQKNSLISIQGNNWFYRDLKIPQENKNKNTQQKSLEKTGQITAIQGLIRQKAKHKEFELVFNIFEQREKQLKTNSNQLSPMINSQFYINQCNYYWKLWLKSALMLEELNHKQDVQYQSKFDFINQRY